MAREVVSFSKILFWLIMMVVVSCPFEGKTWRRHNKVAPAISHVPLSSSHDSTSSLWSTPESPSQEQFKSGVELMVNTAFQYPGTIQDMGLSLSKYGPLIQQQSLLFRRLLLLIGLADLQYRPEGERVFTPWPFPIASSLTQGQRVFFILRGVTSREFLRWLTAGNLNLLPRRKYSSHGVNRTGNGDLMEVKLKTESLIRFGRRGERLLGMNFPLGGVGNVLPNGNRVGPDGYEYSIKTHKLMRNKQLGHLHVYTRDFPKERQTAVLVGIESCAPGTSNQFNCSHTMFSGLRAQQENRSASGGSKWSKIAGSPPPAEYKGKMITLTRGTFYRFKKVISRIMTRHIEEQKELFEKFLAMKGTEAAQFLNTYFK